MVDTVLEFKDVNTMADPLLSFKWVCTLMPPMGGVSVPVTYVENADIPFPEIQQKEGIFAAGTYTYLPGYETFSAFNLKFYEDVTMRSLKYLTKWRENIRRPEDGTFYLPYNYKRELHFSLFDQRNKEIAIMKLFGCWPTSLGTMPLTQESERVTHQQNFSCDGLEIDFKI